MRFNKLSIVKFYHRYFVDKFFTGFKIIPSSASDAEMKSYGLAFRALEGGFMLLYKEETAQGSLLFKLKAPLKLSFYIYCEDQLLLNYSDLHLEGMDQGYFLQNFSGNDTLHTGAVISENDKVLLLNSFQTLSRYVKDDATVSVKNTKPDQKELFQGTFRDFKSQVAFTDLVEAGYFEVETGGTTIRCYAVKHNTQKLFGILELTITTEDLGKEQTYQAVIGTKPVIWRYHLVNREQVSYKDFKLFFGKNQLLMKKEQPKVLGTGESAYLLEMEEPIAMADRYDSLYELEFVREDLKTGQVLSKKRLGLPVPDIGKIKVAKAAQGYEAFSDMYVYL